MSVIRKKINPALRDRAVRLIRGDPYEVSADDSQVRAAQRLVNGGLPADFGKRNRLGHFPMLPVNIFAKNQSRFSHKLVLEQGAD
jgi:hypothetical protein